MRLFRLVIIFLFSSMLALGGCNLLNRSKKDDDEKRNMLLLLLAAAFLLNNQGCQNNSGLVICIPPGLRQ